MKHHKKRLDMEHELHVLCKEVNKMKVTDAMMDATEATREYTVALERILDEHDIGDELSAGEIATVCSLIRSINTWARCIWFHASVSNKVLI